MAISKDPKKTPTPHSDKAASPDDSQAKERNDFSFDINNLYRKSDEKAEELQEIEAKRSEEFRSTLDEMNEHRALSAQDLEKLGTLTLADIFRIDPNDLRAMSMPMGEVRDHETGQKYYVVGKDKEKFEARRAAESYLGGNYSGGGKPTEYRVTTPASIQSDLVSSIDKAAKATGVPAALLGAMAGIESGFGKNKLSPTGAIGTFQQTGSYRDANWAKHADFIAQHVPEVRAAMSSALSDSEKRSVQAKDIGKDTKRAMIESGLSAEEKRSLAFNDDAAAMMTALAAKDFAQKRGIDLNDKKNWWVVYAEHNAGAGSVDRIRRGEMPDKFIRDCNPAIYRGASSTQDVVQSYQSKIAGYATAYEKVQQRVDGTTPASAKAGVEATVAIAKASVSSADALKSGAVASLSNKPDDSNLDARDRKIAQSGPSLIPG